MNNKVTHFYAIGSRGSSFMCGRNNYGESRIAESTYDITCKNCRKVAMKRYHNK